MPVAPLGDSFAVSLRRREPVRTNTLAGAGPTERRDPVTVADEPPGTRAGPAVCRLWGRIAGPRGEGAVLWLLVGYFLGKGLQSTLWTVTDDYPT